MKVLSLFNGISGCHLALDRAEISVDTLYYAEIDKYANKVTEMQYPEDIPLGDVTKWEDWGIEWSEIDLVTAGFPCQAWSVAGKGLGDKDERGMLFWTTLDIIKKVLDNNPKAKFMLENVKMKKEFEEYITFHTTEALGEVHKTLINSAIVSAQNRNRYYWTNFEVSQPKDKGLVLSDIIIDKESERFVEDTVRNLRHERKYNQKSLTCTATMYKGAGNNGMSLVRRVHQKDNKLSVLTVNEAELLQTIPIDFTKGVSNTQRYKAIGNGWTTDVIAHIFKCAFRD